MLPELYQTHLQKIFDRFKIRQKFPLNVNVYNTFVLFGGAIALQRVL